MFTNQSSTQLIDLFENSPFLVDAFNTKGQVVFWNNRCEQVTGYSRDEIKSHPQPLELLYPDSNYRKQLLDVWETLRTRPLISKEWTLVSKDGTPRTIAWYNYSNICPIKDWAFWAIGIDVTEQRKTEQALRLSESRVKACIESTPNVAMQWYSLQGEVLYWNPASNKMFGYSAEEAMGKTQDQLILTPEGNDAFLKTLKEIHETGITAGPMEVSFTRKDGTQGTCLSTIFQLPSNENEPIFACMDVDLSEHKKAEQERSELHMQLQQSQKMEAIGRLAGGIAHDFNNLLTVINGYSEMLQSLLPGDDRKMLVDEIRNAGERAAALTRQLLAFSRKQLVTPITLNLNWIVQNLKDILSRLLGEDVNLILKLDPHLGTVLADQSQVEQILFNLAVNARDAMPSGGTLKLITQNISVDANSPEFHSGMPEKQFVRLQVVDSGEGIPPEVLPHIFEPFFTTKEQGKGTGLGLAMVYGIMNSNGGAIRVDSLPRMGTTFHLYFPRTDALPDLKSQEPLPIPYFGRNEQILLVEDDDAVRKLTAEILSRQGFRILAAAKAEEAWKIVSERIEKIDLLLTDVIMPGMNGPELARKISILHPHLPVIFMSGYTDDALGKHGALMSNVELIHKPFTAEALLTRIRKVLNPSRFSTSGIRSVGTVSPVHVD